MAAVVPDYLMHASIACDGARDNISSQNDFVTFYLGCDRIWKSDNTSNTNELIVKVNTVFKENPSWRNKTFMLALVRTIGECQPFTETALNNTSKTVSCYNRYDYFVWAKSTTYDEARRKAKPVTAGAIAYQSYNPLFANWHSGTVSGVDPDITPVGSNETTSSSWITPFYAKTTAVELGASDAGYFRGGEYREGENTSSISHYRYPISANYTSFEDLVSHFESFPIRRSNGTAYITTSPVGSLWNTVPNTSISVVVYNPGALADNLVTRSGTVNVSGNKTYSTSIQYLKGDPFVPSGTVPPVEIPPSGVAGFSEYAEDLNTIEEAYARANAGHDLFKIANQNPTIFLEHGPGLIQASCFKTTRSFR
jgi:hypothetical protein